MRTVTVVSIMAMGAVPGAGAAGPAQAAGLDPQTRANASTAVEGEAFAHAKYLAYGEEAARTGERRIARLFADTAWTERYDHFAAEAKLIHFVRSNVADLQESIAGEEHEATVMYPTFSRQAAAAGDRRAAALFREIAFDEADHAAAFLRALVELEV
ncbi:ferritin family protein [Micromonospora sp. NPDC051925]|uniref:ferritin family protein n=1 Tax=Micromonospora sp. NPDC051925 TaxID=3364288 RepID=UPI0037CAB9C2